MSDPPPDNADDVPLQSEHVGFIRGLRTKRVEKEKTPATRIREARARQAEQETHWRRVVFYGVTGLISAAFLLGAVVLVIYFAADPTGADPTVLAAWFGASVVQTIGLLAIITKSLFPDPSSRDEPPLED